MEQVRTNKSDMSITDSIMQLDQIVSCSIWIFPSKEPTAKNGKFVLKIR